MVASTRTIIAIYGVWLIVGGIIGYALKGSKMSVIAGTVTGLLALFAFGLSRTNAKQGYGLCVVVALIVLGSSIARLGKADHKLVPGLLIGTSAVMLAVLIPAMLRGDR